jgi:superfamily II DNA/RNA helicase
MKEVYLDVSRKINNSDLFMQDCKEIFSCYINMLVGSDVSIEKDTVRRIISSIQIFNKSEDQDFIEKGVDLLSMLLEIAPGQHPEIIPVAENLFVESANFPSLTLLKKRFDYRFERDLMSSIGASFREDLNTVDAINLSVTDYQKQLWEFLSSKLDIITTAPTSAGKTHIILSYIVSQFSIQQELYSIVLVPTRALISEIAAKLFLLISQSDLRDDIEIITVPSAISSNLSKKAIFVMTQERLLDVLQSNSIVFSHLFIDEAHNIADKSRGVVLHLTIEKILERSRPQVIISMPSEKYQNAFSTIFEDVDFNKAISRSSPVGKILISISPKGKNLLVSNFHSREELILPKGFTGKDLSDVVLKFGKGQCNIVYRNTKRDCENFADKIAENLGEDTNDVLEEAAQFIEEFVHQEFTLADLIRKRVAFHYGVLPGSVRVLVERLVKDGHIDYVACTSTLAEGVNLPAKNLFLQNPIQRVKYQPSERIEDVKIKNIVGRAGRLLHHFSGNIFLYNHKDWQFKDYFDNKKEESEKIPSFYLTLKDSMPKVLLMLNGALEKEDDELFRLYPVVNKLLKDYGNDAISRVYSAPELSLSVNDKKILESAIENCYESLTIPPFILELCPTIGYYQQDKLFKYFQEISEFESHALPHPKSQDLYSSLLKIVKILVEHDIYRVISDASIERICLIAKKWILGETLRSIIEAQVIWNTEHKKNPSANDAVRDVISIINDDIRFRLSNALKCYQIHFDNAAIQKEMDISSVKLHYYFEIGSSDERVIKLINFGLSREAAIAVHAHLSNDTDVSSLENLRSNVVSANLAGLHPVILKELTALIN